MNNQEIPALETEITGRCVQCMNGLVLVMTSRGDDGWRTTLTQPRRSDRQMLSWSNDADDEIKQQIGTANKQATRIPKGSEELEGRLMRGHKTVRPNPCDRCGHQFQQIRFSRLHQMADDATARGDNQIVLV